MAASVIPPAQYCTSCRGRSDATQDFEKIMDLRNIGLVIYRYTLQIPGDERGLADKTAEITKDIFILQNTKDVGISTEVFLSEVERKETCPRCLKIVERALALLKNVQNINKNEVRGVCDHCLVKHKYRCWCDNVLRKFMKSLPFESTKESTSHGLSKMKHELRDESVPLSSEKVKTHNIKPESEFSTPLFRHNIKKYSNKNLDIRERFEGISTEDKRQYRGLYSDEEDFDTNRRIDERAVEDRKDDRYSDTKNDELKHLLEELPSKSELKHRLEELLFKGELKDRLEELPSKGELKHRLEELLSKGELKHRLEELPSKGELKHRLEELLSKGELKHRLEELPPKGELKHRLEELPFKGELKHRLEELLSKGELKHRLEELPSKGELKQRLEELPPKGELKHRLEELLSKGELKHRLEELPPKGELKQRLEELPPKGALKHGLGELPFKGELKHRLEELPSKSEFKHRLEKLPPKGELKHRLEELPPKDTLQKDTELKTFSQDLLLQRSRFSSKSGVLKKDNSFYFPKSVKDTPLKGQISSSVLLKETREKLESKAKEEKERKIQIKLQAERKKIERKNMLKEMAKSHKVSVNEDDDEGRKVEGGTKEDDKQIEKGKKDDQQIENTEKSKQIEKGEKGDKQIGKGRKGDQQIENTERSKQIEKGGKGDKQIEKGRKGDTQIEKTEKRKQIEKGGKGDKQIEKGRKGDTHIEGTEIGNQIEKGGKSESKDEKGGNAEKGNQKASVKKYELQKLLAEGPDATPEQKAKRKGSKEDVHKVEAVKEKSKKSSPLKKQHKPDKPGLPEKKISDVNDNENKPPGKVESTPVMGIEETKKIKVSKSVDDLILNLIQTRKKKELISIPEPHGQVFKPKYSKKRKMSAVSKENLDYVVPEEIILECEQKEAISDIIINSKICKRTFRKAEKQDRPAFIEIKADIPLPPQEEIMPKNVPIENPHKGIIHFALSDRSFIDKGWTVLPTERIVRKMNIYRMRPSKPEFDWFNHNKNKKFMLYDTGEKLADIDDNGRGRWYYRNGRVALVYYDAEEKTAQQRFIIYSSGEPDDSGRPQPCTILAVFDYLGNGIVYDHTGKTRLKYNQTEGELLDHSVGPESHWKWHTLNDRPVIQQTIVDTHMPHKDEQIVKIGLPLEIQDKPERKRDEEMLAIEFDNFIKEKSMKLNQTFKPFQIRMKALKINKNFSLKVLDQRTIYVIYRDGSTNLKLNVGMILDPKEIVDTDSADLGLVHQSLDIFPPLTDSLAHIQKTVLHAQYLEKRRLNHDHRLKIPDQCVSVDKLTSAASRSMRLPLYT